MSNIAKAKEIAQDAHKGQTYGNGLDYYDYHVEGVAENVWTYFHPVSIKAIQVAYMHDVLEDSDYTVEDLREAGFDEDVIEGVVAMTKPKGMDYFDYIEQKVMPNELARQVKYADSAFNLRHSTKGEKRFDKYARVLDLLRP